MTLSNSVALIACLVLFPARTAYAAATDLLRMTISNRLCLMLAAGFVVLAIAIGMPWQMFLMHLVAGFVVPAPVLFGLFAAG